MILVCANEISPANGGENGQYGCDMTCAGDPEGREICGGGDRINIYLNGAHHEHSSKAKRGAFGHGHGHLKRDNHW